MTIGELEEMCHYLGHEWGNDTNVYAVIEDFKGDMICSKIVDMMHQKDGSLYLLNVSKEDVIGRSVDMI